MAMKNTARKPPRASTPRKRVPKNKVTLNLDTLPSDVRMDMQSALARHIQKELEAQGVTEEEILADFNVSRKAHS